MENRYYSPALQELPTEFVGTLPLNGIELNIYNGIWRAVIEGRLKPGSKLKEETICEIYGVSRTVVRKVFIIMAQLGILVLPQNKGAFIATITREEAKDVLDAIRLIISHVVFSLASPTTKLSEDAHRRIALHLRAQAEAEKIGDPALSRMLSAEFRLLLTLIHGNHILSSEFDSLRTRMGLAVASFYHGYVQPNRSKFQAELVDLIIQHRQTDAVSAIRGLYDEAERRMNMNDASFEEDTFSDIVSQYNYLKS